MENKNLIKIVRFAERSKGLDTKEKIKLVLFAKKVKSNAEVILKIGNKNLGEKYELEKLLKAAGLIFSVSRPRSYEEIKKIKENQVVWELEGTYYIYDLFGSKKDKTRFSKYLNLLNREKYKQADLLAGKHYGYPDCCMKQFIKEKDERFLKDNYSYWEYYKKQQDIDRKFPFIFHRPHSIKCNKSLKMNKKYREELKKASKKIYKEYSSQSKSKGNLIVGDISDIEMNGKTIWPVKTGYEYELILKKPFRKHYFLISFLSKKAYQKGRMLKGEVIFQHDYAKVTVLKKKKKFIKDLHHERKLPLLGEVTIR